MSNNFSSHRIQGVSLNLADLLDLQDLLDKCAKQGDNSKLERNTVEVTLERNGNKLKFDSYDELFEVIEQFPEWRDPISYSVSASYWVHDPKRAPSASHRYITVSVNHDRACHVFASSDSVKWNLNTGAKVESFLRTKRSHLRFHKWIVILLLLATLGIVLPLVVGTLWFAVVAAPTLLFMLFLLMGAPVAYLSNTNWLSLCK